MKVSHFYSFTFILLITLHQNILLAQKQLSVKEVNSMVDEGIAIVNSNLDKADSLSTITYYHAIQLGNDSLTAKSHALMGYVSYYRGNYSMSTEYYKKALESTYYQKRLHKRQALLNNLGVNYEFQHNYAEANQAYLKSLQISKQLGDSSSIYESNINLGLLNSLLAKYDESNTYLNSALSYFTRHQDNKKKALCFRNLANLNLLMGNEDSCIRYYNLALQEVQKTGTASDALETEIDFNWALLKFKRYPMVKIRQNKIQQLINEISVSSGIMGTFYLIEGYYFLETKSNLLAAESAFEKAYEIFKEQKSIRQLIAAQEGRLTLYAYTGNLTKHLSLLSEFTQILEDNYLNITSNEIASVQNIHKLELQEIEINQLKSNVAKDKKLNFLLIALLIVSLIALSIFIRSYLLNKEHERKINEKNLELTKVINLLKNNQPESNPYTEKHSAKAVLPQKEVILQTKLESYEKEYNQQLFEKINQLVLQKKLYLNPDLKIEDVAHAAEVNEKEISKAINYIGGQRFTSFINHFRIELAKKILTTQSQDSIKEITFKTGFSSQAQFQRKFKEITGLTPEQFRHVSAYQEHNSKGQ